MVLFSTWLKTMALLNVHKQLVDILVPIYKLRLEAMFMIIFYSRLRLPSPSTSHDSADSSNL